MTDAKAIAGLVGPALVALGLTENSYVNPHLYDAQIPPVVYLSGTLLFIAGVSIIRLHNRWSRGWPILITLVGWLAAMLGLARMVFPHAYIASVDANSVPVIAGVLAMLLVGIYLTFKAYSKQADDSCQP